MEREGIGEHHDGAAGFGRRGSFFGQGRERLRDAGFGGVLDERHALGRHPYFVVEGFEIEVFRDRFGAFNRLGALDWPPIAVFQEPYVAIYDPYQREAARPPDVIPPARPRAAQWCAEPAVWPPRLNLP
jgi:hypothetical protein